MGQNLLRTVGTLLTNSTASHLKPVTRLRGGRPKNRNRFRGRATDVLFSECAQWVQRGKAAGVWSWQLSPSSASFRNAWSYNSIFFTSSLCGAYSACSLIGGFRHFGVNCSSALTMEAADFFELSAPSSQLCAIISHYHNVLRISSLCLVYL